MAVSTKELLSVIESAVLGHSPPTPSQRIELLHAIRSFLPALQSLLSYPVRLSFLFTLFGCRESVGKLDTWECQELSVVSFAGSVVLT